MLFYVYTNHDNSLSSGFQKKENQAATSVQQHCLEPQLNEHPALWLAHIKETRVGTRHLPCLWSPEDTPKSLEGKCNAGCPFVFITPSS